MERTKSEGFFAWNRLAPCGAARKRIRCNPISRPRVKKKQKEAIRRSGQVGLRAKTGTPPVHFVARPVDSVALVTTLWITPRPCGPAKRVSRAGLAVSAVALFGRQKGSWFCSWTLWITPLTLRIRLRPSGSAPIDPQGDQLLNTRWHPIVGWDSSRSGDREGVRKRSSRQGCDPAGVSPAVPIGRFRHVAMPQPVSGNVRCACTLFLTR